MPVSWPPSKRSSTAYWPTGSMAAMFTPPLPPTSTRWPGPWPCTSALGECVRRYSAGSSKRSPLSKATSSVRATRRRTISVGRGAVIPGTPVPGRSMRAADAGPALGHRRRLAGDTAQGLRIGLVEADRGHLVPGKERRLGQPFGIGRDFLQVEAVILEFEQASDVADLGLVLAVDMHADH